MPLSPKRRRMCSLITGRIVVYQSLDHQRRRQSTSQFVLLKMDMETQENADSEDFRKRMAVPSGFRNLLEGLTVEILRCRPENIYKFAADYFHKKLKERQEKGYDDCLLGSQIDGYYRYEPSGASKRELDKAATKIQSTFRGHKVRQEAKALTETGNDGHRQEEETSAAAAENYGGKVSGGKEHEAASRIQAGYRGYNARQTLKARNQAATKIQAGYRGYTVRKDLEGGGFSRPNRKDSPVPWRGEEEAAALKIQSAFRGHRAREAIRRERNMNIGENEGKIMAAENSEENERNQMEKSVNAVKDAKMARDDAATTIQSSYRGYYTRQQLKNKNTAAITIQAHYKGYRARKIRRTRSEAAVTIQSYYRGHRTRESLKKRSSTKTYLEVSVSDEFALHRDSRTSFSLPAGVKFEGNLDEDSDEEIDKMVDKLKAIQESSSPDLADDKDDS